MQYFPIMRVPLPTIFLILGAATAALIAVLSLLRGDSRIFAHTPAWLAPIAHFVLYGLLAFACTSGLGSVMAAKPVHALGSIVLATSLGAAMEYAQKFRAGRSARLSDVLIDAAGATAGALLAVLWVAPIS